MSARQHDPASGAAHVQVAAEISSRRAADLTQAISHGVSDAAGASLDGPIDIRSIRVRVGSETSLHEIARAVRRAVAEAARRRR